MKRSLILAISLLFFLLEACGPSYKNRLLDEAREEIIQTEKAFSAMSKEKGIKEAFLHFAAAEAVLNRADKIIRGKKAFAEYFDHSDLLEVKLTWTPDFVDVSTSADMGYTYGQYQLTAKDKEGNSIDSKGIFHTVWKKQPEGQWKFVYD